MTNDLINNDKRNSDAEAASLLNKRPFDTSGVNWVPDFDESDPPYRNWWAVEPDERDEQDNE